MNRHPNLENLKNMGKGRPKGSKNQFTNLKEAFLEAFDELGGIEGLVVWAKTNDDNMGNFYRMIAKMLPKEVDLAVKSDSDDVNINHADIMAYRDKIEQTQKEQEKFSASVKIIECEA